jgi:hypothetical protein
MLRARISQLTEFLDSETLRVSELLVENQELRSRLSRKWNGQRHPFQCPVCRRYVKLLEAQLDMNDQVLYVVAACKTHGRVTPTGKWTVDDLKISLPTEERSMRVVPRGNQ